MSRLLALCLSAALVLAACDPEGDEAPTTMEAPLPTASANRPASDAGTYAVVEQPPVLIGGLEAVTAAITYPPEAKEEGVQGTVFVQFVVDEEGQVQEPQVIRGVDPRLDTAALEAVQSVSFEPGYQDGEPVRVKFSLPVRFRLR